MSELRYLLLCDGSSDEVLLPILDWALVQCLPETTLQGGLAEPAGGRTLAERVARSLQYAACDLLFVHRDAEGQSPKVRYDEIEAACPVGLVANMRTVGLVPVRMTEAWFLFDEAAIRSAANNPNGTMPLNLPKRSAWESLADPKQALDEALTAASGLPARRRRDFHAPSARRRVPAFIDDYSALRGLTAFDRLERDILDGLRDLEFGA